MGKLQYVNRKISGHKLGQVVAKDLLKRISSNTTHKAALRDPWIDLDVSGKELDDEAFSEITKALEIVLGAGHEDGVIARIDGICLAGNFLTTISLPLLSRIVRLGAYDLKDLDISNNKISVQTAEETCAWETFLTSFRSSASLRRIDLSGNPLGTKAFQVLARAYSNQEIHRYLQVTEPPVLRRGSATTAPGSNLSPFSRGSTKNDGTFRNRTNSNHLIAASNERLLITEREREVEEPNIATSSSPTPKWQHVNGRQPTTSRNDHTRHLGLPSVPYILLDNTDMDDTCALYLSDLIAKHELPARLLPFVPPARAGPQSQQLLEYDQDPLCRGVMYRDNECIGNNGWRVLELAEKARDTTRRDGVLFNESTKPSLLLQRTSGHRRKSNVSTVSSEAGSSPAKSQDLGAVRSKIQAEVLKQGLQGNDLWHASIRMLSVARAIISEPKLRNPLAGAYPAVHNGAATSNTSEVSEAIAEMRLAEKPERPRALSIADPNAPILPRRHPRKSYEQSSWPVTNPVDCEATALKLAMGADRNSRISHMLSRPYRSSLPFGLSHEIWIHIIAQATDAAHLLSQQQQNAVVRWASSRETLRLERAELGKQRQNQIWMVLNGMGCLSYGSERNLW